MARKHNVTGRSRRSSRFVMLEHFVLESHAWRSLSLAARATFIEIAQRYSPGNNGRLAMSGRMLAEALHISRQTGIRALNQLEERGFIELAKPSGFNMKSGRGRASEWRLTIHKCDVTGEKPSRSFLRWQDGKMHLTASSEGHTGPAGEPRSHTVQ